MRLLYQLIDVDGAVAGVSDPVDGARSRSKIDHVRASGLVAERDARKDDDKGRVQQQRHHQKSNFANQHPHSRHYSTTDLILYGQVQRSSLILP